MPDYGNVPPEDVAAVTNAARIAQSVAMNLPGLSPREWREAAYETVLDGILSDWVSNGTTELDADDEEDLANLLRLSADVAMSADESLRDITFQGILRHAMADWVENWNAESQ